MTVVKCHFLLSVTSSVVVVFVAPLCARKSQKISQLTARWTAKCQSRHLFCCQQIIPLKIVSILFLLNKIEHRAAESYIIYITEAVQISVIYGGHLSAIVRIISIGTVLVPIGAGGSFFI